MCSGTLDFDPRRATPARPSACSRDTTAVLVVVAVALVVVVACVLVWRAPTSGGPPSWAHPRRRPRQSVRPALPGRHGAVVDFVDLHFWPTFNVADACIVVGCVLLSCRCCGGPTDCVSTCPVIGARRARRGARGPGRVPAGRHLPRAGRPAGGRRARSQSTGVVVDAGSRAPRRRPAAARRAARFDGGPGARSPTRRRPLRRRAQRRRCHRGGQAGRAGGPPGAGHRSGTLVHGLLARFPDLAALRDGGSDPDRPGIVHRLDRGTSGLLVVARTPDAYRSLVAQLTYRHGGSALHGPGPTATVEEEHGVVDAPIGRSVRSRPAWP